MNHFFYQARDASGNPIKGIMSAPSMVLAKRELYKQGVIPTKIRKQQTYLFRKKIRTEELSLFSRQLATLIQAGIPLMQSFDVIIKGQAHERFQKVTGSIQKDIETGLTLAESFKKHPTYFNTLFCNLVDAGEKSGTLDLMLEKIAAYQEKMTRIQRKIKKALTYPCTILIISVCVFICLLIFVVPQFEGIFKDLNADLPALTKWIIEVSRKLQKDWGVIVISLIFFWYGFLHIKKKSAVFANLWDNLLLKIPILGPLLEKSILTRFARTVSITFGAGLSLVDALYAASAVTGNRLYVSAIEKICQGISRGQSLHRTMVATELFPNMVIHMVAIGEESGTLEEMLVKVADFYEEDVDATVETLSSLLEPLIMCVVGLIVGSLVVALYLPIFKLGSVM
jgi:type IV pilus assembly protein PilC